MATEQQSEKPRQAYASRAELAASGLTKRNQEFMWQVQEQASDDQLQAGLLAEIQANLMAGQKKGQTAKQLYGTPQAALGLQTKTYVEDHSQPSYASYGFWPIVIDNTLVFFMMFSLMFGLMLLFSGKQLAASGQAGLGSFGVLALCLTAITGGLFFGSWAMAVAPRKGSKPRGWLYRIVVTLLLFGAWFLCYTTFAYIPLTINPILPGWIYLIFAGIAYLGFRKWRQKTGMQGGFLGGRPTNTK